VDHIAEQIDLSSLDLPDTAHPDVPPLFLMNVQFPRSEEQKVFGAEDGPGCSVCFYFRIAPQTLAELHGPAEDRSPALKLLAEWCRLAPDDPNFRGRFKVKINMNRKGIPRLLYHRSVHAKHWVTSFLYLTAMSCFGFCCCVACFCFEPLKRCN
jgi:hypothetical protein